ncbi:hypothetical protein J2Y67_005307 [Neobacillus niacini]|nr:hypothetical protein [Neobacillus niacini]
MMKNTSEYEAKNVEVSIEEKIKYAMIKLHLGTWGIPNRSLVPGNSSDFILIILQRST